MSGVDNCGLRTDGSIACWGTNASGPAPLEGKGPFNQIDVGGSSICGLRTDGSIACEGNYGHAKTPEGTFTQVSTGEYYACALSLSGQEYCWGMFYREPLFP
jgi:hypothetical protein